MQDFARKLQKNFVSSGHIHQIIEKLEIWLDRLNTLVKKEVQRFVER